MRIFDYYEFQNIRDFAWFIARWVSENRAEMTAFRRKVKRELRKGTLSEDSRPYTKVLDTVQIVNGSVNVSCTLKYIYNDRNMSGKISEWNLFIGLSEETMPTVHTTMWLPDYSRNYFDKLVNTDACSQLSFGWNILNTFFISYPVCRSETFLTASDLPCATDADYMSLSLSVSGSGVLFARAVTDKRRLTYKASCGTLAKVIERLDKKNLEYIRTLINNRLGEENETNDGQLSDK